MNLVPDSDQREIASTVSNFLKRTHPVRRILDADGGRLTRDDWEELGGLGWFGLGLPEAAGGVGLGPAEEMMLFAELGRGLLPGPALACVVAAHLAYRSGDSVTARSVAAGRERVGLIHSEPLADGSLYMLDGDDATFAIRPGEHCWQLYPLSAVELAADVDSVDPGVVISTVRLTSETPLCELSGSEALKLGNRAMCLAAAFQCGIARAALEQSVCYLKERYQFGQPIGGFQALKHRCADMAVREESARSATAVAILSSDGDPVQGQFLASTAKVMADRGARENAAVNVQNHGGIGFTWEHTAHLFVKRSEVFGEAVRTTARALQDVYLAPASPMY
jgi:alkylation response protein AidB-like acyl-CoA dehydrogenase